MIAKCAVPRFSEQLEKVTNVTNALDEFACNYDVPVRFISDQGTCFISKHVMEFCSVHDIKHILTLPRLAQTNDQVKRVNAVYRCSRQIFNV